MYLQLSETCYHFQLLLETLRDPAEMDTESTKYPGWEGGQSGGAQVIPVEERSFPQGR